MIARLPCFGGCLPLFLLLAGVSLCQGRIGDTLEEEVARYGKPVNKAASEDYAMFKQAPYYITVHFHDQKTDAITYVKAASGTQNAFSNDEIDRLLRINGGGRDWQQSNNPTGRPLWKTGDKELQAVYSESKFLVITTDAYLTRLQAAEKAAKQKEKAAAEETEQKPASANREKGKTGKKSASPKKTLSLQKSATPANKKTAASTKASAAASAKKSTAASAKKSAGASKKKGAASSTKKNAAASTKESATSSVKKNATTSAKKNAGPSNKKGTTASTKKGAAPTKKRPAPSEEQGD
jgi:hypothetical protein